VGGLRSKKARQWRKGTGFTGNKSVKNNYLSLHARTRLSGGRDCYPRGSNSKLGGGRKRLTEQMPEITGKLKDLVEDTTCGDTETPLL